MTLRVVLAMVVIALVVGLGAGVTVVSAGSFLTAGLDETHLAVTVLKSTVDKQGKLELELQVTNFGQRAVFIARRLDTTCFQRKVPKSTDGQWGLSGRVTSCYFPIGAGPDSIVRLEPGERYTTKFSETPVGEYEITHVHVAVFYAPRVDEFRERSRSSLRKTLEVDVWRKP